jgi:hypothetical protein
MHRSYDGRPATKGGAPADGPRPLRDEVVRGALGRLAPRGPLSTLPQFFSQVLEASGGTRKPPWEAMGSEREGGTGKAASTAAWPPDPRRAWRAPRRSIMPPRTSPRRLLGLPMPGPDVLASGCRRKKMDKVFTYSVFPMFFI